MKFLRATFICACILSGVVSVAAADKAPELPTEYPGQSGITISLKRLVAAQKLVESGADKTEIVMRLKEAYGHLEGVRNNKGSFRATAIRLTGQAIKHFEKDEKETAARELADAIEAVHKAGKAGMK